ncbi:DUF962 domain-containing protein [Myxococcus sp. AM009]|uniref:Mpo1-like protein n=1 Tax=unclassified Myxococcus TaxID=2648731 RepID=UPI001595785A|nr:MULTISPECIES: DUF962 domain-containing protein [unclassified Myxococcus]NVJ00134.1 DUF962 domain-containing protein [Myxococcus sp. AM009]NVJ14925.1 DUF962 domain-containing protein [Myxococcus sp. AM010]
MLGDRSWGEWISEYSKSHTHAVNRLCHTVGIPMIAASIPLAAASPFVPRLWRVPAALFVVGWSVQFVGHAFERKPPEFLKDWRFLFVGLRWWAAKVAGRA